MPLSIGTKLGPYEILAPIGAGGFGEVYRARDTRLKREVAIKVLPEAFARDPDRMARFQREAEAVAALSHPNIVVLHDVGADSGITYAVTELLEGETLRERLSRGALPWRKTAEIGAAIAEGLAAAHAKGIIHQDIKPGNLFLTGDGQVKILDFGLAQSQRPAPSQAEETRTLTDASPAIMGTIGYMSPEQVRGLKVEAWSDIFSLGCVLYEMVTGHRAFSGKMATDVMVATLKEEPAPVADSGKVSSPELDRVIERCLAKNPVQRFHSARDLAFALRGMAVSSAEHKPAAPPALTRAVTMSVAAAVLVLALAGLYFWRGRTEQSIDSLAVLPFANVGGNEDTEYLSDGITESLIDSLSELPDLRVMSRSAVFRYKGKEADPQTAGKALGVRAVLTGRITQRGDNLSVSAELVDTADNRQLWGEQYNRKLSDALAVQQEIARQISEKLRAKLGSEQMARAAKHQTDNPEAYQLYLKGRYYAEKFDLEDINKGLDYFHQAIGLDPNYALAYDGLVYAYGILDDAFSAPNDVMPKAREAARRAVEIDDSISESHVEMGSVEDFYDYDFAGGEREFKRAVELGPNYAPAHEFYGWHLAELGKLDEAVAEGRRAEQLDPVSYEISSLTGWWLYLSRRNDDAIAQFHKCQDLNADYPICNWLLGVVYAQQGRFDEAISAETKVLQFEPHYAAAQAELARDYALSGRQPEAQRILGEILKTSAKQYISKYWIATVYVALDDKKRALDALEQAYTERSAFLVFLKADPLLDGLRSEPRFQALLKKMNLSQ